MATTLRRPVNLRMALGAALAIGGVGMALSALPASAETQPSITFCHATPPSQAQVFEQLTGDGAAIVQSHDGHPNDIIPPFDYTNPQGQLVTYQGKNFDAEGQTILENGCKVAGTAPTTTTQPPVTSTAPPKTTAPSRSGSTSLTTATRGQTTSASTTGAVPPRSSTRTTQAAPHTTGSSGGGLAFTGSSTAPTALTGFLMIVAGVLLMCAKRFRLVKS